MALCNIWFCAQSIKRLCVSEYVTCSNRYIAKTWHGFCWQRDRDRTLSYAAFTLSPASRAQSRRDEGCILRSKSSVRLNTN